MILITTFSQFINLNLGEGTGGGGVWGRGGGGFSNILSEATVPNLVSLTRPSLQKFRQGGISDFCISVQSLVNENCYNSRTRNNIKGTLMQI